MTQPPAKLLDISLTQLIGGSMAAATAAALGSRLGVVGTITGAAVGSVVTAIAASLYTGSMARARHVIATTRPPGRRLSPDAARDDEPAARAEGDPGAHPAAPFPAPRGRMAPWRSAAAVFVVAGAFLTGFQLATGTSVTGTTVGIRPEVALPQDEPPAADPAVGGPAGPSASGDPVPLDTTAPATATADPTSTATETAAGPEDTTTQPAPGAAPSSVDRTPAVPATPPPLG